MSVKRKVTVPVGRLDMGNIPGDLDWAAYFRVDV
jgi:hypothetical protein